MPDRSTDRSTTPWVPIEDYTPEALQACEKALRTIVSRIGAWGPRLVLFGGLAPRYIVDSPPPEVGEHTGTTDLDVVVGLELEVDDEGVYTKLQQELRNTGFVVSDDGTWAWERRVDGVRVVLEFFCPVEQDGAPGRLKRNPGGEAGSSISAIQLRGAEVTACLRRQRRPPLGPKPPWRSSFRPATSLGRRTRSDRARPGSSTSVCSRSLRGLAGVSTRR